MIVGVLLGGGAVIVVIIIIVVLLIHLCSSSKKCRLPWTCFAVYDVICYMLFAALTKDRNDPKVAQNL